MVAKPDLLFLSPVLPDPEGMGLAQRAALFVRALARRYRILLQVLPVFRSLSRIKDDPLRDLYTSVAIDPLEGYEDPLFRMISKIRDPRHRMGALISYPRPIPCRYATEGVVAKIAARYRSIDVVHVFRLYLAPYATPFLESTARGRPTCWLDLDDHESLTHRGLASIADRYGWISDGKVMRAEAGKYHALEKAFLSRFNTVFVAGRGACDQLARLYADGRFIEVPNAVRLPRTCSPRPGGAHATMLFVGAMNYLPNEDAARFLCNDILPLIRARRRAPVRVVIAGRSPTPAVCALGSLPEVEVTGQVADLGPLYAKADLVVAPLRTGGGTRIKILEAFAHCRPVVATRLAAEGIEVRDGEHLLLRDASGDIATACVHLLEASLEAARLVDRAYALVHSNYADGIVMDRIERLTAPHRDGLPG